MDGETDDDTTSYASSETETPPYLPPSVLAKRLNWDVFLSFNEDDETCQRFTASLHDALKSKDLRTFMNPESLNGGDTNAVHASIDEVIEDSALAIAIISPKYAESRCCLDELSRMFQSDSYEDSRTSKKDAGIIESKKRVIPVFYRVDPSDVRKQGGAFGKGFQKLQDDSPKRFTEQEIEKWRSALKNVGNVSGYTCPNQSDAEVIQCIVDQVWSEVKNTPEYVVKVDVGLDFRVDKVEALLKHYQTDVRFLNIHGTPGIGKTTLAKAVYNRLAKDFKKRCFISNIRERLTHKGGILSIQNELIKSLSSENVQSSDDDGKRAVKKIVSQNKVLLVLDDVLKAEQLDDLGIVRKCFHEGSRMIVTSRNADALPGLPCSDELYEAKELNAWESLELFSIHALGRNKPTLEFQDISKEIVSLTGGLPLALEVIGSSLVKKTKREWDDVLTKLQCIDRPQNLQQVLKISYDGLEDQEKTVFLDISCLLLQIDMKRDDIVDVLASCGLNAELAIANLVTKSLLKIIERNTLWMHDQIRDMGRQIVIEENIDDTGKRSRLWDSTDTKRILRQGKVTEAVRGLVLNIKKPPDFTDEMLYWFNFRRHPSIKNFRRYLVEKAKELASRRNLYDDDDDDDNFILHANWFEKMKHLKLLRMDYAKLQGDFKYMPSELRWVQWKGCPQKTLPPNIPEELRVLDLSSSKIEKLWSPKCSWWSCNKVVGNLVVLNLSYCPKLSALPDLSGHKHLKKLYLERCVGLTKIHESVGQMSSLVYLNLRGCINLVEFPEDVTGLKSLKELILSDCSKFNELPQDVGSLTSLNQLMLDGTSTAKLPTTLFQLTHLEVLSLKDCRQLTHLPDCLESLTFLKELSLAGSKLKELPCSIGCLTHLEFLNLVYCSSLALLPESVGNIKTLTKLLLNSSSIVKLPSSICSLHYLRVLSLERCRSLLELPASVGGLTSMVELQLDHTPIKILPEEICSLKSMEKLMLSNCTSLEELPESIGQLSNLNTLLIEGAVITQLPESIGGMEKLTRLKLSKCSKLSSLPNSIGKLVSLRILMIDETAVTCLPETFGLLSGLRILKMKKSSKDLPKLESFPTSFCKLTNLKEFDAQACGISSKIDDGFAKLSKLEVLDLGFNSFHSLPSSLKSLSVLKKLVLWQCKELKILPELPSTLEELNAADCHALELVCDLSNLVRLQELRLVNCSKILDVPGLQLLKSLRRLFMGGCNACASAVRRRLSKVALKNMNTLSVPGSKIPGWFSQKAVKFVPHRNLAIKSVMVAVVVSVDIQKLDAIRAQLPSILDIQARIIRLDWPIFETPLNLTGLPCSKEDQLYLSRYKEYHPLVSLLRKGDIIQVGWKSGDVDGIELKRWGIHLIFENDDDYEGDEDSLSLIESEQSVSHRLAKFFLSMDQT